MSDKEGYDEQRLPATAAVENLIGRLKDNLDSCWKKVDLLRAQIDILEDVEQGVLAAELARISMEEDDKVMAGDEGVADMPRFEGDRNENAV